MQWSDLAAAIALYLVLEGMLPFLNPEGMKRVMMVLAALPDRHLRRWGFASMAAGAILLYLIRA